MVDRPHFYTVIQDLQCKKLNEGSNSMNEISQQISRAYLGMPSAVLAGVRPESITFTLMREHVRSMRIPVPPSFPE